MSFIANIFTDISTLTLLFFSIAFILATIEAFVPGFGVFGIGSIFMAVAGVAVAIAGNMSLRDGLILIILVIVFVVFIIQIFIFSVKHGFISRSGLVLKETAITQIYKGDKSNYEHILGKTGLTKTNCRPIGRMEIDNKNYIVLSDGEYIVKNTYVKVIEVDGTKITIQKV